MPYDGVTQYATAFSNSPSTSHTIALNSTFITDANNATGTGSGAGYVHIMLLHENDFTEDATLLNQPSTTGGFIGTADAARFSTMEDGTSANRPSLVLKDASGSTIATVSPNSSGNLDDGYFFASSNLLGLSSGVEARNSAVANSITQSLTNALAGHAKVSFFGSIYWILYRMFLSFELGLIPSSSTIASADLNLTQSANQTGFFPISSTKKTYLCKAASIGSGWVVADYNNLDNWRSSGTYEAEEGEEEAVTYNANFFGSNF
tara:strand:- start:213 stop:1001 length:789 start_codon:yes stop_codon:yes gene_type:complete